MEVIRERGFDHGPNILVKTKMLRLMQPFFRLNREQIADLLLLNRALYTDACVFIQGGAATPTILIEKLYEYVMKSSLKNIRIYHIHTEGPYPFTNPEARGRFFSNSLFTGGNCRKAIDEGQASYVPIFLCDVPKLFRQKHIKLDLALINVTPPNDHGYCSLGPSVDTVRAAIENAANIVAQINPEQPLTRGDAGVHISQIDAVIHHSMPCHELPCRPITEADDKIGALIAENLVDDGATLQTGIGGIPDSVLSKLTNHRHLGLHTEMFSDGVVDLCKNGVITNVYKKIRPGKITSSFVIGTSKVFKFLHDNPLIEMNDIAWVNSPSRIARNPKPTAINSAVEIDLTGQVCSDSVGRRIYSGFGGQVDFIRGAAMAEDGLGKPIIALESVTKKKESKITALLKPHAGVVTTRAHVHYVVTEYGIAYLFGKNLRQRAHALIRIAHPDHRESLEKAAFERLRAMPSAD